MIEAKLADQKDLVTTIQLSDDPSDAELIKALGGNTDLFTLGAVGDWEALRIAGSSAPTLIVGAAPYLHSPVKRRKTCQLTDSEIIAFIRLIDHWL